MGSYIGRAKASRPREGFIPNPKLKLLEQVSEVMRFKHYAIRTETTYREWIKRFIFFNGKRHPREMGPPEVERIAKAWPADAIRLDAYDAEAGAGPFYASCGWT